MTVEGLAFVNKMLVDGGVPYEFGEFTQTPIPSTYFTGEYSDVTMLNEDGKDESTFMVTGTTSEDWLDLMEFDEKIKRLFPQVGGMVAMLDNGSSIAIFYENSHNIPTETIDLKRIQINLRIKEWKVY